MSTKRNQELIHSIQNGNREILFYLSKKYFQSARRMLRRKGFRDSHTPQLFAEILVKVMKEIQQSKIPATIDFEKYLFNSIREFASVKAVETVNSNLIKEDKDIAADCFSILDTYTKSILSARYSDRQTFEQIAVRFEYSNPVIAEFECNKAFQLFENIVKARLAVGNN